MLPAATSEKSPWPRAPAEGRVTGALLGLGSGRLTAPPPSSSSVAPRWLVACPAFPDSSSSRKGCSLSGIVTLVSQWAEC